MKRFLIAFLVVLLNVNIAGAWFSTPPSPSSSNATTLEGHAASYFQVSHAYLTDIAGISAAAGDILYFNGTNWVRLAKDVGKYLKSGASAVSWDTPSGAAHDALTLAGTPETNVFSLSSQSLSLDTQTANYVFAGPTTGAAAAPTFRALVADDIPSLSSVYQPLASALTSIAGLTETAGGTPYFTADNTWAVLAKGTAYQVKHMNSGATAPEWTSTIGAAGTPLTAGYFTDIYAASFHANKVSGTAGHMGVYEANSTDTYQIGWMGPASIAESVWFQFSNDQPTAGQVMAFGVPSGSSGPDWGKISAQTWVLPTLSSGGQVTLATGGSTARTWTVPDAAVTIPANPIGGTLGATTNVIPKANGTGTATLQASGITEDGTNVDIGALNLVTTGTITGLSATHILTNTKGTHDGDNDAATLSDSGESFTTNQFVGMTLYNITDGSSCTVTANNGTTVTCTLAGGTDNNWDTNDVWQVGPGPKQSGSMWLVTAAATIRHPATAGYTAFYMSNGTNKLTVDMASDSMVFKGTVSGTVKTLTAGYCIDSSGSTADDFMGIINVSTTSARGLGFRGTWTDGGTD